MAWRPRSVVVRNVSLTVCHTAKSAHLDSPRWRFANTNREAEDAVNTTVGNWQIALRRCSFLVMLVALQQSSCGLHVLLVVPGADRPEVHPARALDRVRRDSRDGLHRLVVLVL